MHNGGDVTVIFDGSFEGLLTIIFKRYYEKLFPTRIVEQDLFQQKLGELYITVETNPEQSERVYGAIVKIGEIVSQHVFRAFTSPNPDRFMDIFNYIILAFEKKRSVDNYQKLDYVLSVHKMSSYAGMEVHKLTGFVRFGESVTGILYSEIAPVNDVLIMVAQHFTDRLISHSWIIHDVKRKKAAIYDTNELMIAETNGTVNIEFTKDEEQYEKLWREFLNTIAIKERVNLKLQQQFLPLRYRPYMSEFKSI